MLGSSLDPKTTGHGKDRSMEITLSAKRKAGFVKGTVVRDDTNKTKGGIWDTCNDMVISWIFASVSETIK